MRSFSNLFNNLIIGLVFLAFTACSSSSDKPKSFAEAYDVSDYEYVVSSKTDIGLGTGTSLWKMVWNEEKTVNGNTTNYKLIGFLIGPWGELPLKGSYSLPSINARRVTKSTIATTDIQPIGPNQVTNINISLPYNSSVPDVKAWVSLIDINGVESDMDYQIDASYDKFP